MLAGVEYELIEGATWAPGAGYDALKRVNPLAQVPTLVIDGTVLTESAAILIELANRYPQSGLMSGDPVRRANSLRGLVFIAANCYAAIGVIDYPERWCTPYDESTGEHIRAGTRARLHALWETFADMMEPAPWLSGEGMGALDVLAAVVSRWSGARAHLAQTRPGFFALLERVDRDTRLQPIFARHWPDQPAAQAS